MKNYKMTFDGTNQSKYTNKYECKFSMHRIDDGRLVATAMTTSAAVWSTQQDAESAGHRAISVYEETGILPNLCEQW